MPRTPAQERIYQKAYKAKNADAKRATKAANAAKLRKAVLAGEGEAFRVASGWTHKGMQNRCNALGLDWREYEKRFQKAAAYVVTGEKRTYKTYKLGKRTFNQYTPEDKAEIRAAVLDGRGEEYRSAQGITAQGMNIICNKIGIDYALYDPHSPIRVARHEKARYLEAEFEARLGSMRKANCDLCVNAQLTRGKAVACVLRERPVNGSCKEYSKRRS